jgi:hypothetical protein
MSENSWRRATPLLSVVLMLMAWNVIRIWTAIAWYDVLQEFAPRPGAVYTATSGAVWLAVGIYLLWCLWQDKAWAAQTLLGAAAAYSAWYWTDRLVLQGPRSNWAFALLVNLVLLAYVILMTIPHLPSKAAIQRDL